MPTVIIAFICASLFVAAPAAAITYCCQYSVYIENDDGWKNVQMRPESTHFCFLSGVDIEETDTGGENALCRVIKSGDGNWWLQASIGRDSDADVYCKGICVYKY